MPIRTGQGPFTRSITLAGVAIAMAAGSSAAQAERVFGLTSDNRIITFDSETPGALTSSGVISGLAVGDTLIGLDLRPATRTLYSIGTSGNLYAITGNSNGYVANSVGTLTQPLVGSNFGIDFNPTVDRLRLVSDANRNLRINPANGATILDTNVTLNGSNAIDLLAVAYTNSRPGVTSTVLYGIDARSGGLVRATNANAGTYVNTNLAGAAFGPLGVSLDNSDRVDFDISGASGNGFFQVNDAFYSIDTGTGSGSLIGNIGGGNVIGLTAGAVPEPASWAMLIIGFGLVGVTMRRRTRVAVAA